LSTFERFWLSTKTSADVISKLEAGVVTPAGGTSQAFAEFVKEDYANRGKLAKSSGIKLD
jgi:tripartite-type tricarboxylate transporter receptor subunit TctC